MDNLTEVTDAAGHSIGMLYDRLGRKTSAHDPDMGEWHYSYDAAGNLAAQVDANSQAISFYDELNRLKGKTYVAGVAVPAEYGRGSDPGYGGYDVAYSCDGEAPAGTMYNSAIRMALVYARGLGRLNKQQ